MFTESVHKSEQSFGKPIQKIQVTRVTKKPTTNCRSKVIVYGQVFLLNKKYPPQLSFLCVFFASRWFRPAFFNVISQKICDWKPSYWFAWIITAVVKLIYSYAAGFFVFVTKTNNISSCIFHFNFMMNNSINLSDSSLFFSTAWVWARRQQIVAGSQDPESTQGHLLTAADPSQPAAAHPHTDKDHDITICLTACNEEKKQILHK